MVGKNSSKDWKLGHTPRFSVMIHGEQLTVEKGRITNLAGTPLFEDFLTANDRESPLTGLKTRPSLSS